MTTGKTIALTRWTFYSKIFKKPILCAAICQEWEIHKKKKKRNRKVEHDDAAPLELEFMEAYT